MEIKGLNKNATRMLTGLIMGTAAMGCIIEGKLALVAMLLFILYFASREYVKILNHKGFYPSLKMIYISEALLAVIAYVQRFDLVAFALTICGIGAFMWVLFRGRQPFNNHKAWETIHPNFWNSPFPPDYVSCPKISVASSLFHFYSPIYYFALS